MNYKEQLIEAFKCGLLLLVKYGLIIAAIIYTFNFSLQTRDMAVNANIALNEYMKQGWLPKPVNGQIPQKEEKK